jgi:predicted GNAT family N-acyltransferase
VKCVSFINLLIERLNSIQVAINEEIASYEELDGINIMTDARHGWRKNSKDTSVVALREKTHKVMDCVHVTKTRDSVTHFISELFTTSYSMRIFWPL